MKALITGASSGIGRDIAKVLADKGYDLILVARRTELLEKIKSELSVNVRVITADLSDEKQCFELYEKTKDEDIDVLVNNAGFGVFGEFTSSDIERELQMINVNIKAVHILTKLYLKDFVKKDRGHILNVASIAAFYAGPLLSGYYASKNYVLRLSQAISEELKSKKSNVKISVLCPGPVDTEFNKVANVKFALSGLNSMDVAKYAVKNMLNGKLVIIPGVIIRIAKFFSALVSDNIKMKFLHKVQKQKAEK